MKVSHIFPSVRRLERDNERLRRMRNVLSHRTVSREDTVSTLEELLGACEQRKVNFGKITLKEIEEVFTAVVDYRRTMNMMGGMPDPIWLRIGDIFDKYNVKVMEPAPVWYPNSQQTSPRT